MGLTDFIPAGRTSLVDRGTNTYQIQTEYAYRPNPRVTTTITNSGQVVHKIEKKLEKPIESFDEQEKIETWIKRQHMEVVSIIKSNGQPSSKQSQEDITVVRKRDEIKKEDEIFDDDPFFSESTPGYLKLLDRFKIIDGVKYIFEINHKGKLLNKDVTTKTKNLYSSVFKNISDLIEVFTLLPNGTDSREKGVYEIERDKLYLISAGNSFYLIVLDRLDPDINYEGYLKSIVDRFVI